MNYFFMSFNNCFQYEIIFTIITGIMNCLLISMISVSSMTSSLRAVLSDQAFPDERHFKMLKAVVE